MMSEKQIRQETSENDGFENKNSGLWTQNLTVGYDRIPLIRDVELHVHPGEILTLIGPNGSGKSTILKTITKQLSKIAGTIYVEGTPADKLKDSEISKQLSMVMTERLRTELMTGREVVASGRYPYTGKLGILSEEDWKKVDEAIELVNAKEVAEQDYILTPGRYVGIAEQEADGEPFEEKMTRLTTELYGLFDESHKLEDEICKKLAAIGYGK